MKNSQRLFLVLALITAEVLCAQTTPPENAGGPRQGGPGGRGGPGGPGGPGRFHPVLRALDADRNGEISAAEIAGAATALKALDANSDGNVSLDELRPTPPGGHPARPERPTDAPARPAGEGRPPGDRPHPVFPVMLALDANADGALSAAEIANAATSLRALDANGDGKLTRDELLPLPPVE